MGSHFSIPPTSYDPFPGLSPLYTPHISTNPIPPNGIQHLLLSGGGTRGVAHIGVYETLLQQKLNLRSVTGVSAGAIVALFIAMGVSPLCMRQLSYNIPTSHTFRLRYECCEESMLSFKVMREYIRSCMHALGCDPDVTFQYLATICALRVVCFNRDRIMEDVFSAITTPDVSVVDAVLASCAIHHVFPPQRLRGPAGVEACYLDGGTRSPLGFGLAPYNDRTTLLSHLMFNSRRNKAWRDARPPVDRDRMILVDTSSVKTPLLGLSTKDQDILVDKGRKATVDYYRALSVHYH